MNKQDFSNLDYEPRVKQFLKKLFDFRIDHYRQARAIKIYHGKAINGMTLQSVDMNLKHACPNFYGKLKSYLGEFNNFIKMSNKEVMKKMPPEWLLFYLGSLPIYTTFTWDFKDEELMSKLNQLERYFYQPRTTRTKLKTLMQEETENYYDRYYTPRKKQLLRSLSFKEAEISETFLIFLYRSL